MHKCKICSQVMVSGGYDDGGPRGNCGGDCRHCMAHIAEDPYEIHTLATWHMNQASHLFGKLRP